MERIPTHYSSFCYKKETMARTLSIDVTFTLYAYDVGYVVPLRPSSEYSSIHRQKERLCVDVIV